MYNYNLENQLNSIEILTIRLVNEVNSVVFDFDEFFFIK